MIKFAQYPIALASIVAILIGIQSFDAAIPHTKVENPNLKVELFAQGSNSSQAPRLHTTTLTLDTIPDVLWGSSTTLRGKLIDSNASDAGVGGQTITFSGTGAANVGSVTTNTDGTFTISGLAPNTVGTGWTVQAHYAGDSIASYTASDSTTYTYNTIKHTFSLVLSNTPYVFWNSSTSFTATLADFADGAGTKTPPSGKTVTFTGSGVISSSSSTITATTDSNGKATGMGTSPNTVASGWAAQARFVGDSQYNAADSNTQLYNTLKHTASLTASSLAPNVPWTSPTSFPVLLADLNRGNAPISGRT
nr:carboxypeptidase-like regulatory domain-containing protein [Thermoproteota archaeon]